MAFESLGYRYTIPLSDVPSRWLPLIHPYDPDLPLFPIYYFHAIPQDLPASQRPNQTERVFGYVEKVNISDDGDVSATIVTNKNLQHASNSRYLAAATNAVRERLGINSPVTKADVTSAFLPPLDHANRVLGEIWERVVADAYGGKLPFGRLWDEVFGLARFVASWNSQSGRKGELIQTHYFASRFGERIQTGGGISTVDFFLLPTIRELSDPSNPMTSFPLFKSLVDVATDVRTRFCDSITVSGLTFSKFRNPAGTGRFDTEKLFRMINELAFDRRGPTIEAFNAFGKGPQRTIIFLLMLADIRMGAIRPDSLNANQCGAMYEELKNSYQSPKVLEIYAQQCFGNGFAMPIDTWVDTFLKWPLNAWPEKTTSKPYTFLFSHSRNLGKVERLIWVTAQARKVHSSACHDALWCLKKSSPDEDGDSSARGGNPLACNICISAIRDVCPCFTKLRSSVVCFNRSRSAGETFSVSTDAQKFVKCEGESLYQHIVDDFSTQDAPTGYAPFPVSGHDGSPITMEEFVKLY